MFKAPIQVDICRDIIADKKKMINCRKLIQENTKAQTVIENSSDFIGLSWTRLKLDIFCQLIK